MVNYLQLIIFDDKFKVIDDYFRHLMQIDHIKLKN